MRRSAQTSFVHFVFGFMVFITVSLGITWWASVESKRHIQQTGAAAARSVMLGEIAR